MENRSSCGAVASSTFPEAARSDPGVSADTPASETAGTRWRECGLAAAALVPLALILARPLLPQDPRYHGLADTRTLLGIPNFGDVASNIVFLLVGAAGLRLCLAQHVGGAVRSWIVFFIGVTLVSFGSAWYHWSPGNASLVWDRLPMTIAFMGLFSAVLSEHAGLKLERVLLVPSVALGVASVAWWAWADDLRPYIWVQAAPLICIVYALVAYRGNYSHRMGL